MDHSPRTEVCALCGSDLPEDPPTVTVPKPFGLRLSPLASPGITELAFCCERHRRDWGDAQRRDWPAAVAGWADGADDAESDAGDGNTHGEGSSPGGQDHPD